MGLVEWIRSMAVFNKLCPAVGMTQISFSILLLICLGRFQEVE